MTGNMIFQFFFILKIGFTNGTAIFSKIYEGQIFAVGSSIVGLEGFEIWEIFVAEKTPFVANRNKIDITFRAGIELELKMEILFFVEI